jgi:hypothetical protein
MGEEVYGIEVRRLGSDSTLGVVGALSATDSCFSRGCHLQVHSLQVHPPQLSGETLVVTNVPPYCVGVGYEA